MEVCFATNNANKIKEINAIVAGISVKPMIEFGLEDDIPETGTSLEENSSIKAKTIFKRLGIPVIADDSGLEVEALDGRPGVYSARFAGEHGNHEANNQLLLRELKDVKNRKARFRTVITYMDQMEVKQFEGIVEGQIIEELRGEKGFGYDPLFVPEGHLKTFAEMDLDQKNTMSHRARAFLELANYLNG